ncbi:hypothetical protein [Microbispora siamensis]|nr:hypothetical protein [Microbispora siamensis]
MHRHSASLVELLPRWLDWLPRLSHGEDAAEEAPEERVPALA